MLNMKALVLFILLAGRAHGQTCGAALQALATTQNLLAKAANCTNTRTDLCRVFAAYSSLPSKTVLSQDLITIFFETDWAFDASWANYAIQVNSLQGAQGLKLS